MSNFDECMAKHEEIERRLLETLSDCITAKKHLSQIQKGLAQYILENLEVDSPHFDGLTRVLRLDFICHRCFRESGEKVEFYGMTCPVCGGEAV